VSEPMSEARLARLSADNEPRGDHLSGLTVDEVGELLDKVEPLRAQLAEIGNLKVQWGIRTDSTDWVPDSPNFGSDEKIILDYAMDGRHAQKHSEPWGWQAVYRIVGPWHEVEREAPNA